MRFFISVCVLAIAMPLVAQEGPVRTSNDARVVFEQNFEEDWETWSTREIDRITQVEYYRQPYNPSLYDSSNDGNDMSGVRIWDDPGRDWSIYGTRDTLLILTNGVSVSTVEQDKKAFAADSYTIVNDEGSTERQDQLDNYAVDGGKYYFRYISMDTVAPARPSSYSGKKAARFSRNLFVRGLEIEDESSYRLTFYVKTQQLGSVKPTLYADIMRGWFSSEKPFSMGLEDDATNLKYKRTFEFTKDDFRDNEWEKITFMTYYLNDSIADSFVFVDGYWWTNDWKWRTPNGISDTLCYIRQSDKFFIRLGFASDSTVFSIDNVSVTKSWIGGVEYYNDMLRVDFGYETNIKELAALAKEKTNIPIAEIPGEYCCVWGLSSWGDWEKVPIRSAELHEDGYMYMWTKPFELDGFSYDRCLDEFDSVFVSFINPVDNPDLRLCYNGALFPKSLDTEWIANGKMVPDFINEIAYPNPNIGAGVFSLFNLPPAFQGGVTAEDGSFQLDGTMREFTFRFSKKVEFDNQGENSFLALMHVVKAGVSEVWTVKSSTDSTITFQRPMKYCDPLQGDYEFKILQIRGKNTDWGEDVTLQYSFGPAPQFYGVVAFVSFENSAISKAASKTMDINGFSMEYSYQRINEFAAGGLYTKGLTFGVSAQLSTGADGSSKYPTLYYAFNITEAGNYDFNIKYVANHGSSGLDVAVLDAAGNTLSNVETIAQNLKYNEGAKIENVDVAEFTVEGLPVGSYKLKIAQPAASDGWYYPPYMYGNSDCYTVFAIGIVKSGNSIPATLSISYPVMSAFDNAQTGLNTIIATAEKDKDQYTGSVYDAAVVTKGKYADFNKTTKVTAPSIWNAATTDMTRATSALEARMAVVDAMWNQYNASMALIAKYDSLTDADGVNYKAMDSYKALKASCEEYEDYICKDKSDADIKAVQTIFEDGQKALDAQKAIVDDYQAALAAAKAAVEDKDALTEFDSYIELDKVYSQYKTFDFTASAQDDTKAATSAILLATSNYKTTTGAAAVNSIWYQALADLAQTMGADFGDNTAYFADRVSTAKFDDGLAKVYRKAITAALYRKIADGENVDSIPLSAFIKNNELYATPKIVERMDKQMPANVGDLKAADAGGANIQHTRHQWNDSGNQPIWIMIPENDYTDLLNGWTVRAIDTNSGNRMVTVSAEGGYDNFKNGETFWNGELAMDWNSKATLAQTIEDIPVGMFSIGAEFLENSNNATTIEVTVDGNKTSVNVDGDRNDKFAGTAGVDNVVINNGTADLLLTLTSDQGWSRADNFYLVFRGKKAGFDYAQAAVDAQNELASLIDAYLNGEPGDNPGGERPDYSGTDMTLYINHLEAFVGETCTLPVLMNNSTPITGFQCDIQMPSVIGLPTDGYGDFILYNGNRTDSRKPHSISGTIQPNGSLRILSYSATNVAYSGNSGQVACLQVEISPSAAPGEYAIYLKNQILTDANGVTHSFGPTTCYVTVNDFQRGDANGDESVNVGDISTIAAYILNGNSPIKAKAADANLDNAINVGDIAAVANYILFGTWSSASQAPGRSVPTVPSLSAASTTDVLKDGLVLKSDDNLGRISAVQFDMLLPEGTVLDNVVDLTRSHNVAFSVMEDGRVRVLVYSLGNRTFAKGDILKLDFQGQAAGLDEIIVDNIVLAGPDACFSQPSLTIMANGTTGVVTPNLYTDGDSYTVGGIRQPSLRKGMNVIDGKIVFVK